MPAAERLARVDQNDVNVARKLQMLKPIVEDEPFHTATRKRHAILVAIWANAKQYTFPKAGSQKLNLIACRRNLRAAGSLRFTGFRYDRFAAVSSRKNCDAFTFPQQPLRDPQDHGRFAGPANC